MKRFGEFSWWETLRLWWGMVRCPVAVEQIERLLQDLSARDRVGRAVAAWGLGMIGTAAGSAQPALVSALSDESGPVRGLSAAAIGRIAADPAAATVALTDRLASEPDPWVRQQLCAALAYFGPGAEIAQPWLWREVRNGDAAAAEAAIAALGGIGANVIPEAVVLLNAPQANLRRAGVVILGLIGATARPVTADLATALRDPEATVRAEAAWALGEVAAADLDNLALLESALDDPDRHVRWAVAEAVIKLRPPAIS